MRALRQERMKCYLLLMLIMLLLLCHLAGREAQHLVHL